MTERVDYIVTVKLQHPNWNEVNGVEFDVEATSKSDAIKQVRDQIRREDLWDRHSGRRTLSARLAREA